MFNLDLNDNEYNMLLSNESYVLKDIEKAILRMKLKGMADIDIAIELDKSRSQIQRILRKIEFKVAVKFKY